MATPDELCRALSDRMPEIMRDYFPNAKKVAGDRWSMGDVDGGTGKSCGVFRGRGGIYLATDSASGETLNVLGLLHRATGGSWRDTFLTAKKICGIADIAPVVAKKPPPKPNLKLQKFLQTEAHSYMAERGILEATLRKYRVTRAVRADLPPSERERWNDEYIVFPFDDSLGSRVMYKWLGVKRGPKGEKEIGSTYPQYSTLWGWHLVDDNTREIGITEGEIDAMSMSQLYPDIVWLSLPTGASNLDWIGNDWERLECFEKVYIVTDTDQPGEMVARNMAERLGLVRSYRVRLPAKDANEFLLNRAGNDINSILETAATYDPERLVAASSLSTELRNEIERAKEESDANDFIWPIPFRFRPGELTVLTGYTGCGKSQLLYQLALHEMVDNKRRLCIASFEIDHANMLMQFVWLASKGMPDPERTSEYVQAFEDKLWYVTGTQEQTQSVEGLIHDFDYANKRFGCDFFVVDALLHLTKKGDAEGTDLVAKKLAAFAKKSRSSVLLICHADAKKHGTERVPDESDILGGQGIGAAAHNIISIWRNKKKEMEPDSVKMIDEPDARIYISKQRATGNLIFKPLLFDKQTRQFILQPRKIT